MTLRGSRGTPQDARMTTNSNPTALSLALLLALAAGCGPEGDGAANDGPAADAPAAAAAPTEPAQVEILSPTEGEVVTGPDVLVRLGATGVTITAAAIHDPGTGHHHIFIDRDPTPLQDTIPAGVADIRHLGQGQTEFLIEDLEPGEHRFIAVIAHWTHIPLDPPAMDTVHFTVVAPPES
jgi:hypothetical protein